MATAGTSAVSAPDVRCSDVRRAAWAIRPTVLVPRRVTQALSHRDGAGPQGGRAMLVR
ncbi:hypothetical protein [Streptomyces sp. 900116325]